MMTVNQEELNNCYWVVTHARKDTTAGPSSPAMRTVEDEDMAGEHDNRMPPEDNARKQNSDVPARYPARTRKPPERLQLTWRGETHHTEGAEMESKEEDADYGNTSYSDVEEAESEGSSE